jgi:PAS domain S-box-containing protein
VQDEIRRAVDTIPGLVWSALPDGQVDFLNLSWCEYTGLGLEEACGWGWQQAICSEDLPGLLAFWRDLLAAGRAGETEARLRRSDGAHRWFLVRVVPLHEEAGPLVRWYGQWTEIEDRKQAEALLDGEKRLLEMVTSGRPLPAVLDGLCRLVEDTARGCHCSIVLLDPGGATILHGAAPSLPASYNESIHGRPVDREAGPCGMAASLKTQVIVSDVAADTQWDAYGWRTLALAHGLRSCWSTPVLSLAGKALGTFALYQREPGSPTPLQQALIERFTHIASIAIERASSDETPGGEAAGSRLLRERYRALTRREREVLGWVVAGRLNKQIAAELGISEATVKAHRGQVMRKMQAGSLADLVRIAGRLDLPLPARPPSPTIV